MKAVACTPAFSAAFLNLSSISESQVVSVVVRVLLVEIGTITVPATSTSGDVRRNKTLRSYIYSALNVTENVTATLLVDRGNGTVAHLSFAAIHVVLLIGVRWWSVDCPSDFSAKRPRDTQS